MRTNNERDVIGSPSERVWLQNNSLRALKQRRQDRLYMYRREVATVIGPSVDPKDQRDLMRWILCRAKAEGFTEKDLRLQE